MAASASVSATSSALPGSAGATSASAAAEELSLVELSNNLDSQVKGPRILGRKSTDEVAGTQVGLEDANMVECVFDCGPPRHMSNCSNTGTQLHPRWMCSPCNGACKALQLAARKTGHLEDLKELRQSDPEAYKAKIRACRVRCATDPVGCRGLRDNRQRAAAFSTFLSSQLTQKAEIEGKAKRKWMDFKEFIAFLKFKKGEPMDTQEQKQAFWKAALDNPDVLKNGSGADQVILVDKGTTWAAIRSRALLTSVNRATNLETQKQVEEAMVQVAQTGAAAGAFSGAAFKGIGDMFRPEVAAASSSSQDAGQLALAAAASAAPAANVVVPESDFAPFGVSFGGHPDGLAAIQWDESQSGRKPTGTPGYSRKKSTSTLIAGPVLEAQNAARATLKAVKKKVEQGKGNLVKEFEKLLATDPTLVSQSLKDSMHKYKDALAHLKELARGIPSWAASTLAVRQTQFLNAYENLELKIIYAQSGLAAAGEQRQRLQAQRLAQNRAAVASREKVVKPYVAKGSPGVLLRWIYKEGALTHMPAESEEEQGMWHTGNLAIDADEFDRTTMAVWSPKSAAPGAAQLRNLPGSYGARLDRDKLRTLEYLSTESGKPEGQGQVTCNLRISPKGQPTDTVEQLHWVPLDWKDRGEVYEALRSFGAPWLLAAQPGVTRCGEGGWALPCMGCFLSILTGQAFLVAFPVADAVERGAHVSTSAEWSLGLSQDNFNTFAAESVRACLVTPGSSAWIPYGWTAVLVANITNVQPMTCIQAPYLNAKVAGECNLLNLMIEQNIKLAVTSPMWETMGKSLEEWLRSLVVASPVAQADDAGETLKLEDIKVQPEHPSKRPLEATEGDSNSKEKKPRATGVEKESQGNEPTAAAADLADDEQRAASGSGAQ